MRSSRLAPARRALGAVASRLGAVRPPLLVRRVAGRAGGMAARRRGSVLVLVLGALAMLAVVTVIYATVGRETRRTSYVVERRDTIQDTVERIADYIAQVIADDVLSTHVLTIDDDGTPVIAREAWDYPFTDPRVRSVPSASDFKFNPIGTAHEAADVGALASDPWLASTEPVSLDPDTTTNEDQRDNANDWLHISNLSPDGLFVNLFNLRPEAGGFDCPPGIEDGQMSDRLSYIDENGDLVVPTSAERNQPWLWDSRQFDAFWPVGSLGIPPSNDQYPPYQWADADGDGFFDSRWFELVDAGDPNNVFSLLPRDDRFRWFVAARVVDLSALVNVNTATDLRVFYDQTASHHPMDRDRIPLGLTPADVDLRRLLTLDDLYEMYNEGYDGLSPGTGNADYSGYDRTLAREAGQWGYNGLRALLNPEITWTEPDLAIAWLDSTFNDNPDLIDDYYRPGYYRTIGAHLAGAGFVPDDPRLPDEKSYFTSTLFGAGDLLELLTYRGINDPGRTSALEAAVGGRYAGDERASPLRSNRPLDVERDAHDADGNGAPDDHAMIWSAVDVRQRLTTISSARPLISGLIGYNPFVPPEHPDSLDYRLRRLRGPASPPPPQVPDAGETRLNVLEALREATRDVQDHTDSPLPDGLRDRRASAAAIFNAYLDALAPYAGLPGAWDPATTKYGAAHYGSLALPPAGLAFRRTPELAVRIAAHLTANLIDAYDRDLDFTNGAPPEGRPRHQPSAFTLVLGNPAGILNNPNFPWFSDGRRGQLRVPLDRGPDAGQPVTRDIVNIYGIEPQPFVVEAATMFVYTDAPDSAGGDDEGTGPVTIDPKIPDPTTGTDNSDFLFGVFAVQLVNPFDVEVRLTGYDLPEGADAAGHGYSDYYLEFGGNLFKLAEIDASMGFTTRAITLGPREAKVVYALMVPPITGGPSSLDPREQLAARLRRVGASVTDDQVKEILRHQFGIFDPDTGQYTDPVLIGRMNPITGGLMQGYFDFIAEDPSSPNPFDIPENKSVLLWRVMRSRPADEDPASDNVRYNDLLADRLAQPVQFPPTATQPAVLARRLRLPETAPPDSMMEVDGSDGDGAESYTIALWNTIKRSDNPPDAMTGTNKAPRGAIPAYCLEPRWGAVGLQNKDHDDGVDEEGLERTDFDDSEPNADDQLSAFLDKVGPGNPPPVPPRPSLIGSITTHPDRKNATTDVLNGYEARYPQIVLDNREFRIVIDDRGTPDDPSDDVTMPTMRVADLLMPLAIGPTWAPDLLSSTGDQGTNPSSDPAQWLTLSQALAVALRYTAPPPDHEYFALYAGWTDANLNPTDRGNLRLDRYVPFVDNGTQGQFDPAQDELLAPGIPLALNILNTFTTFDPELASITRGTPGLININTAPLAVLRLLPLLNPTTEGDSSASPVWPPVGLDTYPITDTTNDIAAALVAYRDKMLVPSRDPSGPAVTYADTDPADPATWNGRQRSRNVAQPDGRREQPGFASDGEILAMVRGDGSAMDVSRVPNQMRIDYLAIDGRASGGPGVHLSLYDDGNPLTPRQTDDITDDYSEKLLIAAALGNCITTRSDTYAVWFVVHGYQRSDVEGLTEDDPLVPSVAKRFLMVLDRSNVRQKGQKPRVLLFKELPM